MKKYLVIGNPIEHSLSPKLHNNWMKKNNIKAVYEKIKLNESDLSEIILEVKKGKIDGINITAPFKTSIIPYLDRGALIPHDKRPPETYIGSSVVHESVNTIFKINNKVYGANTDTGGFHDSLRFLPNLKNKKVFILGAGGVVYSIILVLKSLNVSKIYLSNRTKIKAEEIRKPHTNNNGKSIIEIIDWENLNKNLPQFDMIINATSLGLKKDDHIKLNYKAIGKDKIFYDLIYNPDKTNFLLEGEKLGNEIINGHLMFVHQAARAFNIWHGIYPLREYYDLVKEAVKTGNIDKLKKYSFYD